MLLLLLLPFDVFVPTSAHPSLFMDKWFVQIFFDVNWLHPNLHAGQQDKSTISHVGPFTLHGSAQLEKMLEVVGESFADVDHLYFALLERLVHGNLYLYCRALYFCHTMIILVNVKFLDPCHFWAHESYVETRNMESIISTETWSMWVSLYNTHQQENPGSCLDSKFGEVDPYERWCAHFLEIQYICNINGSNPPETNFHASVHHSETPSQYPIKNIKRKFYRGATLLHIP